VTVRVLAFARIREMLGTTEYALALAPGACVGDVWAAMTQRVPALSALASSTRIARNGRIAEPADPLEDGDEIALLPPAGGG
jgi:molybdopterin converting factor small subunit